MQSTGLSMKGIHTEVPKGKLGVGSNEPGQCDNRVWRRQYISAKKAGSDEFCADTNRFQIDWWPQGSELCCLHFLRPQQQTPPKRVACFPLLENRII